MIAIIHIRHMWFSLWGLGDMSDSIPDTEANPEAPAPAPLFIEITPMGSLKTGLMTLVALLPIWLVLDWTAASIRALLVDDRSIWSLAILVTAASVVSYAFYRRSRARFIHKIRHDPDEAIRLLYRQIERRDLAWPTHRIGARELVEFARAGETNLVLRSCPPDRRGPRQIDPVCGARRRHTLGRSDRRRRVIHRYFMLGLGIPYDPGRMVQPAAAARHRGAERSGIM
jgi:hypothetical protein